MRVFVLWTLGVLGLFLCATGCDDSRLNDIPDPCEGKEIKPELCDGIDNDCDPASLDGAEEPLLGKPCDGEDSDFCEEGFWICDGYNGMICTDESNDNLELCDGKDNDCDPSTPDAADEPSLRKPCDGPDSDLCKEGIWECGANGMACTDDTGDKLDLCDGEDNDCNLETADGIDAPSFGQLCDGTDKDLCEEGSWECGAEGMACSDNTDDNLELCDGNDNDCDPCHRARRDG